MSNKKCLYCKEIDIPISRPDIICEECNILRILLRFEIMNIESNIEEDRSNLEDMGRILKLYKEEHDNLNVIINKTNDNL